MSTDRSRFPALCLRCADMTLRDAMDKNKRLKPYAINIETAIPSSKFDNFMYNWDGFSEKNAQVHWLQNV